MVSVAGMVTGVGATSTSTPVKAATAAVVVTSAPPAADDEEDDDDASLSPPVCTAATAAVVVCAEGTSANRADLAALCGELPAGRSCHSTGPSLTPISPAIVVAIAATAAGGNCSGGWGEVGTLLDLSAPKAGESSRERAE